MQPLDFKIEKIDSIRIDDFDSLSKCVDAYLIEADDRDMSASDVVRALSQDAKFGAWFVRINGKVEGFLSCSLTNILNGNTVCFTNFLYVTPLGRQCGAAKKMSETGIDWVKKNKVKRIMFSTRRNAKAMARFLPGNWEIDSTVISLCV